MSTLKIIDEFKKEYSQIIENFSIIDEKDPISPIQLSSLQNSLQEWVGILKDSFVKNTRYLTEYEKKNQSNLLKYQQRIKALNDSLNKTIKNITKDYIESCQKLKQRIEIARKDTDYRIEQYEVEYNYFISTSEQNKLILTNDFIEAKHRFDYQKDEAKESYLEIVKKNNAILKKIKEQLNEQYVQDIQTIVDAQAIEIQKLKNYIEIQENELSIISSALEDEKSNMKEKYRQESANLNENIKKIAEEKNKIIDKARGEYTKSINDANIEKENKKTIYQAQAQALLREFVTKINVIDENTSVIKKEFDKKVDAIKREYYTDVFKKTKHFHEQLKRIYDDASNLDKYTNKLIRFKNKQHQTNIALSKREKELILLELTKDNTVKILNNRNDKNFLDIDKNFALKNINDQEQYDNKYYQENDNIYENDFNYTVKTANYRFSQQANLLRCQSQIRTKLLERNYDGISANYYKKIETIQNKINNYKITLDITQRLNQVILEYVEAKHNAQLHLQESNNLLEIEKNKLLKEFNMSQYEYNISNINLAKEYGFKKIDLENQKAEENMKMRITLERSILDKNSVSNSYSIKREELNERFAKMKSQIINNNDLKSSKESYVTSLMENDILYIEQFLNSYILFLDSYKKAFLSLTQITLKDISLDEKNCHFIESFLNRFLELFLKFLRKILNNFIEKTTEILNNKMAYVYSFKYQSSLTSLEDQHSQDLKNLKEKKNEILDKIDSSNKTIENFRQKIFTLINDSEMLIHNNQPKKKKNDMNSQTLLKQTDLKIRDYKEKIDDFTKMNRMYNDDLAELNAKIAFKNTEYRTELLKIEKMIRADMKIYVNFKSHLEVLLNKFNEKMNVYESNHFIHGSLPKNLTSRIDSSTKSLNKLVDYLKRECMVIFDGFVASTRKDIEKREHLCSSEFKNDVKEFNIKYNKAILEYQTEYTEAILSHEKIINEQSALLEQMMAIYDHKLSVARTDFQKDSNALDLLHTEIRNHFFLSYHALDDNHQNIIQYHQRQSTNKEARYALDTDNLNKEKTQQITILNQKLKNFIQTKNEEIEHLPVAFKFNSKMLNKETKKKNLELHESIKEAKTEYNNQNKLIEKNIKNLKVQLSQDKFDNEFNQKRNIIKEKKNNISNLKQSLRNIRINL